MDNKLDTQNGKLQAYYSDQYSLLAFSYRSASNDRHDLYFTDNGNIVFYHGSDIVWQTTPVNIKNRVTFNRTDFMDRSTFYKVGRIVMATIQLTMVSNDNTLLFTLPNDSTIASNHMVFATGIIQNSSNGSPLGTSSIYSTDLRNFYAISTGTTVSNCALIAQIMWVTQA